MTTPGSTERRFPSLGSLMLVAMGAGAAVGGLVGEPATAGAFLGDIFIRLLLLAAVPLLFLSLVAALAGANPPGGLGGVAARMGAWVALTAVLASAAGLAAVALTGAGRGMALSGAAGEAEAFASPEPVDFLFALIPESALGVFAGGQIPAIVVFGLMLGAAARTLDAANRERVLGFCLAGAALFRRLVAGVLWFGPIGVAALAAAAVGEHGAALFGPLARYVGAMWAAHATVFAVQLAGLFLLSRFRPVRFLRDTTTVWTTTMATCSSLASLAASLDAAERMRLPRAIYRFTLPLGAQFNKNGSAVLLAGGYLFTAQAVGVEIGAGQLAAGWVLAVLLSAAAPGVPNGGVVNQLLLVQAFGLPVELIVLVAGIYRLVDMPTTTVNILGDLVGTSIVAGRGPRRAAEGGS